MPNSPIKVWSISLDGFNFHFNVSNQNRPVIIHVASKVLTDRGIINTEQVKVGDQIKTWINLIDEKWELELSCYKNGLIGEKNED